LNLFRDGRDFEPTLRTAAEELAVPPIVIEKDYWIVQILRCLTEDFGGAFIFKGGTSLSKGYDLTGRFSEDVDLLIISDERTRGELDRLMKGMAQHAADQTGGEAESTGHPDKGRSRSYVVTYAASQVETGLIKHGVLLEMGVRGGAYPHTTREIDSFLGTRLKGSGFDTSEYVDLASVEVPLLHPGRTLLEKLAIIEGEARRLTREGGPLKGTIARHFYDIHFLLNNTEAQELLSDREEFSRVVADIRDITRKFFTKDGEAEVRPKEGFGGCEAFRHGSEISETCRRAYEETMGALLFEGATPPTWNEICDRVADKSHLL